MVALQNLDGTAHVPGHDEAFVRVRMTEPPGPTSTPMTVYLANGTALVVCAHDLVRLASTDDPEE